MEALMNPVEFIKNQLNKGHARSVKAKKNIIASFLIRSVSIAISILLVPLTIDYVNPSRYGIWLTVSSIVGWFSFFDIGLTHGLRNKFASAKTTGDDELAQIYVSTTYAILTIIFSVLWLFFLVVNNFLNWASLLNVSQNLRPDVSVLAVIVFTYFCLQFILRIITTIMVADQQPAKASFIELLGQILSLLFVAVLVKTTQGSLLKLGLALCISPLLVLFFTNVFLFKGAYKKYRPQLSKVRFTHAKGLVNLGLIFFVIQVANVIQYQTANIIIARNFGTTEVTAYNIVFKYFNILNMVFIIFITPFWSASTEAYLNNDIEWIKAGIKKYGKLTVFLLAAGLLMLVFSDKIYDLWLGHNKIKIDFWLSFSGLLFFFVCMFGGKYISFLNGISALRIQFWASVAGPFVYAAVALILIRHYKMGVHALFVAAIISNYNAYLLAPIQYYLIIYRKKKGLWIK